MFNCNIWEFPYSKLFIIKSSDLVEVWRVLTVRRTRRYHPSFFPPSLIILMEEEKLKKLTMEELSIMCEQSLTCDHHRCDNYEQFHQCFNYSHVLCPSYVDFFRSNEDYGN